MTSRTKQPKTPPSPPPGAHFGADNQGTLPLASGTAVVHTAYDVASPPAKPASEGWTRFVCVSDTHAQTFHVPDGDVLLRAGDLTQTGRLHECRTTVEWIAGMPHPVKMYVGPALGRACDECIDRSGAGRVVAGNHDLTLDHTDGWYDRSYARWHRHGKEVGTVRCAAAATMLTVC